MGIGGHILSGRNLRRLSRKTGLDLDRAYIRNKESQGVIWTDDGCIHYDIDPETGEYDVISNPIHWSSCTDHLLTKTSKE
jgi:hypothetical protein